MNDDSSLLIIQVLIDLDDAAQELELELLEAYAGELIQALIEKE